MAEITNTSKVSTAIDDPTKKMSSEDKRGKDDNVSRYIKNKGFMIYRICNSEYTYITFLLFLYIYTFID